MPYWRWFRPPEGRAFERSVLLFGVDTTAHTMAWAIWHLASRSQIQARWAEEARAVLGAERFSAEYEAVEGFRYGEAVLRESMRLKPVFPALLLEPSADRKIAGIRMPAGTGLCLLTRYADLHGSGVERSFEFEPERWLEEDGSRSDQNGFLTFGAGPRVSPDAFLAFKAAMGMIARNFEVELDPDAPPVTERLGFTMHPEGLRVRLRRRLHSADRQAQKHPRPSSSRA